MSNFSSLEKIDGSLQGTAVGIFSASTPDSYATITAAGYLNDINKKIKANDRFFINYADASTFPLNTGEAAVLIDLKVAYDPILQNWNLVPVSSVNSNIPIINYGMHSATYSYAGGSATFTIPDTRVMATSIVLLRVDSSANAVVVENVAPQNGQIAVTLSGNPGASVLEYIVVTPSVLLESLGVHATKYINAGGSTTITITDPIITASSVVVANFASQTNASKIDTVTATAGTLTIVCSANPGASVIDYLAVSPSSALTALGCYAAQYTNAGGSATTAVTDANITANSIPVADWSSQANASNIEKVTPTASTLTVLSSADPGASVLNYIAISQAG